MALLTKRQSRGSMSWSAHNGADDFFLDCKAAYLSVVDDVNEDIVSRSQLIAVLQQAGRNPTSKVIDKYWISNTDAIDFSTFCDICKKEPPTTTDDLLKSFRKIDLNGDGYISLEELYKVMTSKGEKMSMSEVKAIIDDVDENKDGRLDYKEFSKMVIATADECKKVSRKIMERKERRKPRQSLAKPSPEPSSRVSKRVSELDPPKPSPRKWSDERRKSSAHRNSKWTEPRNLKDWWHKSFKGIFFVADDDKSIINHWYSFRLPEDSTVWITIQPSRKIYQGSSEVTVDTMLYVLKNKGRDGYTPIALTEQQDGKGRYGVSCDLSAGVYTLAPFTTGCHLRVRKKEPNTEAKLTKKDKDGNTSITKAFRVALEEIFQMSDLDGNGLLSREELSMFNMRTSNEGVMDDEWDVVEENVEMKSGEITKSGFVRLNEMEVEDPESEKEDLWVTLSSMGYNRALELDEACPFLIDVYAEECTSAVLRVKGFETGGIQLDKYICQSIVSKGGGMKVKGMKDVLVHTYQGDHIASVVIENKSSQSVDVRLDCNESKNCISNTESLVQKVHVSPGSSVVGMHLLPRTEAKDWSVSCISTAVK